MKYTDGLIAAPSLIAKSGASTKAVNAEGNIEDIEEGVLPVKVVCNASWWDDSQDDVLTDKCYDNSIAQKGILIPHIADHTWLSTSHVADTKAVYTQKISLKELGLDMPGSTTCAIMESSVREDYNPQVYRFYKNKKINQHSIGLQYVSIGMCINDEEFLPEYELWQKYFNKIINKDKAEETGYFWIVPEIRWLENSCVLFGANELTPTLSNNKLFINTSQEPSNTDTLTEPLHENKSMVICPGCKTMFNSQSNNTKCPGCGQYVSSQSTTVQDEPFDLLTAISETTFI